MDINTLMGTISAALIASDSIAAWATAQYASGFNVVENLDMRNTPDADDCPIIVISHGSKTGGLNNNAKTCGIGVDILVYDDRIETSEAGVVKYTGGYQAEACRKLVVAEISDVIPDNLHLESVVSSFDTITQFPFSFIAMDLIFIETRLIGSDPFE